MIDRPVSAARLSPLGYSCRLRNSWPVLAALTAVAGLAGCRTATRDTEPARQGTVTVEGVIVDQDGKPLRGALVRATVGILDGRYEKEMLTDRRGRFVFRGVPWKPAKAPRQRKDTDIDLNSMVSVEARMEVPPATLYRNSRVVLPSGPRLAGATDGERSPIRVRMVLATPCDLEKFEERWPNGKLKAKGMRFVLYWEPERYELHGKHRTWHENGQLQGLTDYVFGRKTGTRLVYWPSGKVKIRERYDRNGHPAELRLYRADGSPAVHGTFKWNAEAHKEFRLFGHPHDRGKDFEYRDYHGPWTYWDAKGKVLARGQWRDGQPWSGTCRTRVLGPKLGPSLLGMVADTYEFAKYRRGQRIWGTAVESDREDGE